MRYLKKFLITEKIDLDELKKFCDNTLVYLTDVGFKFEISEIWEKYPTDGYVEICLKKSNDIFYWSEFKDDIIPFIEYLYDKYNCYERITIISKFNSSTQLEIANVELGDKKTEIIKDYLENLEIGYGISKIIFYINI
jgi:hypothetical protein